MVNEMKEEINGIKGQIEERTFAPGTSGVGEPGKDIGNIVVEGGEDSEDDGLTPEVKTEVSEGGNGNNVVDNVVIEDGVNNVVDEGSGNTRNNEVDDTVDEGSGKSEQIDED